MRTETTTRTLYQFDELTDDAKAKARDWYREANASDNYWSECVLDEFTDTIAPAFGWTIGKARGTRTFRAVYFSGFWSQGDGACFEGTWYSEKLDVAKLKAFAPTDTELHRIADEYARLIDEAHAANPGEDCDCDLSASVAQFGRGNHEVSTRFDIGASLDAEAFKEVSRDLMRWLYRALESAYEWTNADEQVDESIRANEYEFTEAGEIA